METDELSATQMFDLLGNDRRRFAIFYLYKQGTNGSETLGEIATTVASWENDVPVAEVSRRQRKRVYDALQQHHVPALVDHGIVVYDPEAGTVELTETGASLGRYLDFDQSKTFPWHQLNLGLGLLGAIIALLHLVDILTVIPAFVSLFGLSLGITLVSLMQLWGVPSRFGLTAKPPDVRD
jgi:hypothetical protein